MTGFRRLQYALKTALGVAAAVVLAMWFHWDRPYWAGITVLVVMLPYLGASLEKSILRLFGTWLGALAGVLLTTAFVQTPSLFTAILAVVIVVFVYLAAGNYAVIMGVGTMVIIIFSGLQEPSLVWSTASYRCAEVALGVLVAIFVNASLWPRRAGDALSAAIRSALRDMEAYYAELADIFVAGRKPAAGLDLRGMTVREGFSRMENLLHYAARESGTIRRRKEHYLSFILRLKQFFISLTGLRQCLEGEIAGEYRNAFIKELNLFGAAVRQELENFGRALTDGHLEGAAGYRARFRELEVRLDSLRKQKIPLGYPLETALRVLAFFNTLGDCVSSLASAREELTTILSSSPSGSSPGPTPEGRRFRFDPDRFKFAVRIAVGIVIALYGWWYFRWPAGMQAVISFLVVTAQPSIRDVNIKSISRLSGALAGCGLALGAYVLVLPHLESIWGFALLIFGVIFLAALVNAGPPRYAYTGFQAGICFLLTVAQGYQQSFSIVPALNRSIGIILGALLGALVVRFLWPAVPRRELLRNLARLFDLFRESLLKEKGGISLEGTSRAVSDRTPVFLNGCRQWLSQLRFFRPEERAKVERLLPLLQVLSFRLLALFRVRASLSGRPPIGRLENVLEDLRRGIEEDFRYCRDLFREEEIAKAPAGLEKFRQAVEEETARIRREEHTWDLPPVDVRRSGALVIASMDLATEAATVAAAVTGLDFASWDSDIPL